MCRIFGFRSVIHSQVHSSLVHADNALMQQSQLHPDGWGIAYYVDKAPHVVRATTTAVDDHLFRRVSGIVSSQTVLAHIRKSTVGKNSIINTHPFQFGRWVFAHNGHVLGFDEKRAELVQFVKPEFRRFILGETDSELLFYLILTEIDRLGGIHHHRFRVPDVMSAIRQAVVRMTRISGPFSAEDRGGTDANYLSFLITDGQVMVGHQGGKSLHFSTFKSRCSERETCPSFAPFCEARPKNGRINHLLFSSEPLVGENIWHEMKSGDLIGVDASMRLVRDRTT